MSSHPGISRISKDSKFKEENFDTYLLSMLNEVKGQRPSVKDLLKNSVFEAVFNIDNLIGQSINEGDSPKLAKYLKRISHPTFLTFLIYLKHENIKYRLRAHNHDQ